MADCPALRSLLAEQREALNARFALYARGGSRIDPAAFLDHCANRSPLAVKVHEVLPERTHLWSPRFSTFPRRLAASLLGPARRCRS